MHFLTVTLFLSLFPTFLRVLAQDTFAIYSDASDIDPLPTDPACAQALASTLQCSPLLVNALPSSSSGRSNLTASDLQTVCTSTCINSLMNVTTLVDAACVGYPYVIRSTSYIASFPFRNFAYYWRRACLVDTSTSEFCLNEAQASTPTGEDQDILDLPNLCSACVLQELDIQMTSPFGWDAAFVDDWNAVQSTCQFAANNTIPDALLFDPNTLPNGISVNATLIATPTPTPASSDNCVFGGYTIQNGDTCESISSANSLSPDQFISINGLDLNCTKLPAPGGSVCLSGSCELYTVKADDSCVNITEARDISWSQLLKWNPQINIYCNNLDTQVGKGICVGPPGGGYTPSTTIPVLTGTPTAIALPTEAPVAPGSDRSHCGQWYVAVPGDTCPQILQIFQMTNETFYELNPLVNSDCSNLLSGFSYCVQVFGNLTSTTDAFTTPVSTGATMVQYFSDELPAGSGFMTSAANITTVTPVLPPSTTFVPSATPTPTSPPGTIDPSTCFQYYRVQTGDTCFAIEIVNDISDAELRLWNPNIDANCANLLVDFDYCVDGPAIITTMDVPVATTTFTLPTTTTSDGSTPPSVPTNVAPGTITTGCNTYYTIQSGDNCATIDTNFGITFQDLLTWNPEIDENCSNIQLGLAYCVNGPTTPGGVPSNIAPGTITSDCNTYYTIQSGDTCGAIDTTFGITFENLRTWNPEIDEICSNIQLGLAYCVSGPSTPGVPSNVAPGTITSGCNTYYTIQSGDTCGAIDTNFSISFQDLRNWNPEIDDNCSNIQLGLAYCVSGPTSTTSAPPTTSPTAPGTIAGCQQFYTVVSGDNCGTIDGQFGITLAQFLSWNPSVDSQCTNIQIGVQYCVKGPSDTTTSAPSAPTNVAPGTITSGCNQYYTVVSGDFCAKIDDQFSITLDQFRTWNTGVNTDCSNLQLGLQYCVSGP